MRPPPPNFSDDDYEDALPTPEPRMRLAVKLAGELTQVIEAEELSERERLDMIVALCEAVIDGAD